MNVLIVDDDASVRGAFSQALERAGFTVLAVPNGLAALAELRRREYAAIVCDVHMQFLEGRSLYQELQQEYPALVQRVIFATGWAEHDEVGAFLKQAGRPVLGKPVDLKQLVATVRAVAGKGT